MAQERMRWADGQQLSYLAWTWNTWGAGDALLTSYSGQSSAWGTDVKVHFVDLALPRLALFRRANAAYMLHDVQTAVELYDQVARTPPSDAESPPLATGIGDLSRFRALIALASIGQEDSARHRLDLLVDGDPGSPMARLAAQFWDQYSMTASVRAACAQLAPDVEPQAATVLATLASMGVEIRHDELCVVS
jgi:hypothetical protein